MSLTSPDLSSADLEAAATFLRAHSEVLITSHVNTDGDGIAGGLAMVGLLRQFGVRGRVLLQDVPADGYAYLEGWDDIDAVTETTVGQRGNAIVLDCPNYTRIGNVLELLTADAVVLNVDHHHDNERFGAINLVSAGVCSTCEMIYHLALFMGLEIGPTIAEQLYTGILFDTGGFRYSLTTPTSLEVGADLVRRGARLDLIADRLYNNSTYAEVKLIGRAIDSMLLHHEGRVATMSLTHEQMQQGDSEAAVNYGLRIKGVEVTALFKEESAGHYRISMRSRADVDVSAVAGMFGGGGHSRAAGARQDGSLEEVRNRIVAALEQVLP
ncbi:MAG: bifunctional oligoribonuclease/PAP phosphatase NrnA [bacterium]|nr:bifunctional oligoribonuclease/PAP phosphatase NrnA [bacterium]